MALRVHLLQNFEKSWIEALKRELDENIIVTGGEINKGITTYDILIAGRPEKMHLDHSPALKKLIIPWSGLPIKTRELVSDYPDLEIHNLHHNAAPAAETAMTLLLAAARNIIPTDRAMRQGDWSPRYDFDEDIGDIRPGRPLLLGGKTALILGYGAIGRKIAAACRGLEMKIIAVKREVETGGDETCELYGLKAVDNLLSRADVLIVSLPLTPETENLIGKEELSLLPDEAIIVNIARGPIINEEALYNELKSNRLRAGLDVWYNYPREKEARTNTRPTNLPFHELDNVVFSPHMGGHSDDTENLRIKQLAELLNGYARTGEMANRIDPERGY